ncbi:hypothetical protein [Spongiactinospora gelatinilytica]|uniref:hypothetical protein n=1 Tax=Spongiactinospora gelatinilytica TaxID=2666298 RepID=UPI0011B943E9|nr:hypothetical protein [Spongiactinospora gelatinilytica]
MLRADSRTGRLVRALAAVPPGVEERDGLAGALGGVHRHGPDSDSQADSEEPKKRSWGVWVPLLAGVAVLAVVLSGALIASRGRTSPDVATNPRPEPPPVQASVTTPPPPLTGDDRLLSKRITGFGPGRKTITWLQNCAKATWPEGQVRARSVLRCEVITGRPATSAYAITFADSSALDAFLAAQSAGVDDSGKGDCAKKEGFNSLVGWTSSEGVPIGRLLCRRAGPAYRLAWSFENDAFVDANGVPFAIIADGPDPAALIEWWKKTPV